jgi:nucleoside-diphosphate-sugar epimerase
MNLNGFNGNDKVMLLGASGQLGSMLRKLWPEPDELVCQSRYKRPGFVSFDQCLDVVAARRASKGARTVVCLSGVTPRNSKQSGDPFSLNTDLALAAVQAAHDAKASRVFLLSSAAVYGQADGIQHENATCEPVSYYGRSKLDMERTALKAAAELGQAATVLRIGNVAGADAILGSWRGGMEIDSLPDGTTPCRSYIGPETLTRVIYGLTQVADLPDIINIAAPGSIELGGLLDAAALAWAPRCAVGNVIKKVELSTSRLERHLGSAAEHSTAAGVVAEWSRFNRNSLGYQNELA